MPGAAPMITTGTLSFWTIIAWVICGTVPGDDLSFWLGHHFKGRFSSPWEKSVFFGCFVGPVRPVNRLRYRQQHTTMQMTTGDWPEHGWQQLPAHCLDLGGEEEQIMNLQYAGTLSDRQDLLQQSGWQQPLLLTPSSSLHWLMANPDVEVLPVLPQVHDGHNETLLSIHTLPGEKKDFWALQLWSADAFLENSDLLWVGTLSRMTVRHYINLIYIPRTVGGTPVLLLPGLTGTTISLKSVP